MNVWINNFSDTGFLQHQFQTSMMECSREALEGQFDRTNKITKINEGLKRAIQEQNPPPPPPLTAMMMQHQQQPPMIPQPQPTFDLNEFDHFMTNHQQHEVQYGDDFMNNSLGDLLGINDPTQGNIAEHNQVDALTEERNTLQASVDTLKQEKLELEYNLQRSQASANTIRVDNEALLNQVRELRHSVNTFRTDKEVLQNQVDSLEMSARRFREEKEALIALKDSVEREKQDLMLTFDRERKELQDQIDVLKDERTTLIKEHGESYTKLVATTSDSVRLSREMNVALEEQLKLQKQEYNHLFAHWDELSYNLKRVASETPEGEPDAKRSRSNSVEPEPEGEDNTFELLVSRINDAYQQIIADQHCGPYFRQKIDLIYQQMPEHKGFFDKVYEIIKEAKQSDDVDLKEKAIKLRESWKKIVA